MATPYESLPIPDANEYPYNLQGDQTKARALADAAQSGNSSALEKLKTLGLDAGANLISSQANQPPSGTGNAPTTTRPSITPSPRPTPNPQVTPPTPSRPNATRPNAPAGDAAQQKQSLAQDRLQFEKQKYADQQEAARARQQAAEKRGPTPSRTAPKPNQKAPAPKQGKAPKGKGGGGGGGGGKGSQSPEQKAREKGRMDRAMDRENRRTDRTQERRDSEEYAKRQGYSGARAMEDAQAKEKFFGESRERNRQQAEATKAENERKAKERAEANSNKSAPDTLGKKPGASDPSTERYTVPDGQGGTKTVDGYGNDIQKQPKMVAAYGVHKQKMVRARGDLA